MTKIAKKIAQDSKNILRREDYRRVKHMDRTQFESFCKKLYMMGSKMEKTPFLGWI